LPKAEAESTSNEKAKIAVDAVFFRYGAFCALFNVSKLLLFSDIKEAYRTNMAA